MKLILNGEPFDYHGSGLLTDLLRKLKIQAGRISVLVNDEVIPVRRHDAFKLRENDRVELLTFAAGG